MHPRLLRSFVCFAALVSVLPQALASDYAQRKAAASLHCEAINPSEYQTGLAFNPDGYRSLYVQSECFQNAAVQFREATMCDRVRRRFSLFSSSWGVSTEQCRKLVDQGIATDRAEIEAERLSYLIGPPRLLSFRIERNGNGRDFDILPEFAPGYSHGYTLSFEIIGARKDPVLLHSDGYYLDQNPNLRIYVRQSEIRTRFPEFQLSHPYQVKATLTLSVGNGGLSGYWSDEFLEKEFPARARSQTLIKESAF